VGVFVDYVGIRSLTLLFILKIRATQNFILLLPLATGWRPPDQATDVLGAHAITLKWENTNQEK